MSEEDRPDQVPLYLVAELMATVDARVAPADRDADAALGVINDTLYAYMNQEKTADEAIAAIRQALPPSDDSVNATDGEVAWLHARVAAQLRFIEQSGKDLEGYVARYGPANGDPGKLVRDGGRYGSGGAAIYAADMAALRQVEADLERHVKGKNA